MARKKMAKNKTPKEVWDNAGQDKSEFKNKPVAKKALPGAEFKKKVLKANDNPWQKRKSI